MLNRVYCKSMFILVTAVTVFFTAVPQAVAVNSCQSLFETPVAEAKTYGQLKQNFSHNSNYSYEVDVDPEIKNQCSLGTCHLYAWSSNLESMYLKKNKEPMQISSDYLSAMHWREVVIELITKEQKEDLTEQFDISLGSTTLVSRNLIRKYGVVPSESWQSKAGFNLSASVQRANAYFKNIIARAWIDISKAGSANEKLIIAVKARHQITEIFNGIVGRYPEKFVYRGKEYTPISFQEEFFPELQSPLMQHVVSAERKAKVSLTNDTAAIKTLTGNIDYIEQKLKEMLDAGKMIYLTYTHDHQFVDKKTGIMTISGFEIPSGAGPLRRADRETYGLDAGGHAVHVVGYDLDSKTNKVIKWKIKNSWGQDTGELGYYHMYADYFRAFAKSFSYYND